MLHSLNRFVALNTEHVILKFRISTDEAQVTNKFLTCLGLDSAPATIDNGELQRAVKCNALTARPSGRPQQPCICFFAIFFRYLFISTSY